MVIQDLCIWFLADHVEEWNQKQSSQAFSICGDIIQKIVKYGHKRAFLRNIVSNGIHIWQYKCITGGYIDMFGIQKPQDQSNHCRHIYLKQFSHLSPNDTVDMKLNFFTLILSFRVNGKKFIEHCKVVASNYKAVVSISRINTQLQLINYHHVWSDLDEVCR